MLQSSFSIVEKQLVDVNVSLKPLGINGTFKATDIWTKKDRGLLTAYKGTIGKLEAIMLKLYKQ